MAINKLILQLDYLKILRNRKHWNLYFIVATQVPGETDQTAITTMPKNELLKLRHPAANEVHFEPEGQTHGTGLILFERNMPTDNAIEARLWLMQSSKEMQEAGKMLERIGDLLPNGSSVEHGASALGKVADWIFTANSVTQGLTSVGKLLENLPDRNLGMVVLDNVFDASFNKNPEIDLYNSLSTGFAEVGWSWIGLS